MLYKKGHLWVDGEGCYSVKQQEVGGGGEGEERDQQPNSFAAVSVRQRFMLIFIVFFLSRQVIFLQQNPGQRQ